MGGYIFDIYKMRPRKRRKICGCAPCKSFKPQGIPARNLEALVLNSDELEAIRLADVEDLGQVNGALKMATSQSTFQRILTAGRKKVARALVEGKALHFEKSS